MGNKFLIIDASKENSRHEMEKKTNWVTVNLFAAQQEKEFTS